MKTGYAFLIPILSLVAQGLAAQAQSPQQTDNTPPSYDIKPQALQDLQILQQHFVQLGDAFPAEKFTWRPTDGVRSVSEIILHVAMANYNFASNLGTPPAVDVDLKTLEKSTTDKSKAVARINQSFEYLRSAIEKRSNKELQTIVPKFGPDASEGDLVFVVVGHAHEHMGQLIAYARMNGIVPPWTAEAQKNSQKSTPK